MLESNQATGRNNATDQRSFMADVKQNFVAMKYQIMAMMILAIGAVPSFAQSATLEIDSDVFINSINLWLGMAISIVAIGVGIAGAFALARYVGQMILSAFSGKI